MYRVGIYVPDQYQFYFKFLVDWAGNFADLGVVVDFNLPDPDLMIAHHDIAWADYSERKLRIPTVVLERADQGNVSGQARLRELLAQDHVKIWLKDSSFRNFMWNNEIFVSGSLHRRELIKYPSIGIQPGDWALEPQTSLVQAAHGEKIRFLPPIRWDRFKPWLALTDFEVERHERQIDVSFIGTVDYRDGDRIISPHRALAAYEISRLRGLRTVICQNGGVSVAAYRDITLNSKIGIAPWGLGEPSMRDYELMLAGTVMVKPNSDYLRTHEPDIYQSGKYYVPCRPDFSDLREVVDSILDNWPEHAAMAKRARADLIRGQSKSAVFAYFMDIFRTAGMPGVVDPGISGDKRFMSLFAERRGSRRVLMDLHTSELIATRCRIVELDDKFTELGGRPLTIQDDMTKADSHDLRMVSSGEVLPGSYEMVIALRARERNRADLILHSSWAHKVHVRFDIDGAEAYVISTQNGGVLQVSNVHCTSWQSEWCYARLQIEVGTRLDALAIMLALALPDGRSGYDGDGVSGLDVGMLSVYEIANERSPIVAAA